MWITRRLSPHIQIALYFAVEVEDTKGASPFGPAPYKGKRADAQLPHNERLSAFWDEMIGAPRRALDFINTTTEKKLSSFRIICGRDAVHLSSCLPARNAPGAEEARHECSITVHERRDRQR